MSPCSHVSLVVPFIWRARAHSTHIRSSWLCVDSINRRGYVRQICSDNGSNFVGGNAEFKKAIKEMDQEKINGFLLRNNIDWMGFQHTNSKSNGGSMGARDSILSFNPFIFVEEPQPKFKRRMFLYSFDLD